MQERKLAGGGVGYNREKRMKAFIKRYMEAYRQWMRRQNESQSRKQSAGELGETFDNVS